jgi:hypothetical protein
MKINHKYYFLIIVLIMSFFSCKRPHPPRAIITTLDTMYKPVSGVTVRVYAQPNGGYVDPKEKIIEYKDVTDGNGNVEFEFRNEAILNVEAKQTNPNRRATGVIFLQEGKVTEKKLILR